MEKNVLSLQAAGVRADGSHCSCRKRGRCNHIGTKMKNQAKRSALQETANVILPISRCRLMHIEAKIQALNRQF